MKLLDFQFLALQLMLEHGLVQAGWTMQFNKGQGRYQHGWCYHNRRTLAFVKGYAERCDIPQARDIILHEIAHALCSPGEGHGVAWRNMCRRIGAVPNRCGTPRTEEAEAAYASRRST